MNDAQLSDLALDIYLTAHEELAGAELGPYDKELVNKIYVKITEALAPAPTGAQEKARLTTIAEDLSDAQWNALLDVSHATAAYGGARIHQYSYRRPTWGALVKRGLIEKIIEENMYGAYRTTELGEKVSEALD